MTEASAKNKRRKLESALKELGSVVIAFSGGVDSAFLTKVAADTLSSNGGRALAVTAKSGSLPKRELDEAIELARLIGIKHRVIESDEMSVEGYVSNPPDRCYYCKSELFGKLTAIANDEGFNAVLDGANADDMAGHRPGSKAADEMKVRSLLREAGLTKKEIRVLSRGLGLPTWDKPAFACLASRFPYGEAITDDKLAMVERSEQILAEQGFTQFRVRYHGDVARIELNQAEISKAVKPEVAEQINTAFTRIGFKYVAVDIIGYRTGSMNEGL
ncbi:MAG TPA: ATP-dependent sacrificial sulfur transferase LarE [Nitrospirae bacterium]|nr:ATP-dependent sacrificial sulfur transferase LarE [Nitrospirota bacterium]